MAQFAQRIECQPEFAKQVLEGREPITIGIARRLFGIPLVHHVGVNAVDFGSGSGDAFGIFGRPFYAQDNSVSVPENFAPDQTISHYRYSSPFSTPGGNFPDY